MWFKVHNLVSLALLFVLVIGDALMTSVHGRTRDRVNDLSTYGTPEDQDGENESLKKDISMPNPHCGSRPKTIDVALITSVEEEVNETCVLKFQADDDFFTTKKILVNLADVHISDCTKTLSVYFDDHTYGIPDYELSCNSPDLGVVKSTFRFVTLELDSPLVRPDYFNILLTVYDPVLAISPGFRTRVTQKALDFATTLAVDILMSQLPFVEIPDIQQTIGTIDVTVKNVEIIKFQRPVATFIPHPGSGISLKISRLNIKVLAEYEAAMGLGFFGVINKSGTVSVITKNMSFTVEVKIGINRYTGQPSTVTPHCFSAGDLIITFEGGWADMLNVGSSVFGNTIRSLVASQVCSTVQTELDKNMDPETGTLPINATILDMFDFKYGMTEIPFITEKFVETSHMGTFSYQSNEPAFEPTFIPEFLNHTDKMAYVYVTDYVLNSAFHAGFDSGMLKYYVTSAMLPAEAKTALKASCLPPEICVGIVYPGLPEQHPHGTVEISVYANEAPNIIFYDGRAARVKASATLDFFVNEDGRVKPIFSLNFSIAVDAALKINGSNVSLDLKSIKPEVDILSTDIGDVGTSFFYETLIRVGGHLVPKLAEDGFEIPTDTGFYVHIVNPEIIAIEEPGLFVVATDISVNIPEGLNLLELLGQKNDTQTVSPSDITLDDVSKNEYIMTTKQPTTRLRRRRKHHGRRRRSTTTSSSRMAAEDTYTAEPYNEEQHAAVGVATDIPTSTRRPRRGNRRRKVRRGRENGRTG